MVWVSIFFFQGGGNLPCAGVRYTTSRLTPMMGCVTPAAERIQRKNKMSNTNTLTHFVQRYENGTGTDTTRTEPMTEADAQNYVESLATEWLKKGYLVQMGVNRRGASAWDAARGQAYSCSMKSAELLGGATQ
jgi:hypothetical protein